MRFIEPTCEYESQIRDYRQEFLDEGGSMDGTGALRRMEDPIRSSAARSAASAWTATASPRSSTRS